MSFLSIPIKSRDEKPGVSATRPPSISNNSTCLVVCLPLPKALDISPVAKFKSVFNLFNKDDFPTPVCPVKTLSFPFNIFFISLNSLLI